MSDVSAQDAFLRVKDLACEDRPREKLMNKGLGGMTDSELLSILLRSGSSSESVVHLSHRLLSMVENSLDKLGRMSVYDLTRLKGMGPAKAMTVMAAFDLGRRRIREEIPVRSVITSSKDAYQFCAPFMMDLDHEEMYALFLNRSNGIIACHKISQGGISAALVDIRLVLKPALEALSSGIILLHNHPSGNLRPSHEDILITRKLKDSARLMDIVLTDHLIIGGKKWFSFSDEGIL